MALYRGFEIRAGGIELVERGKEGLPIAGRQGQHLTLGKHLFGALLGGADQEGTDGLSGGGGGADDQLLDFMRGAQVDALLDRGSGRHN